MEITIIHGQNHLGSTYHVTALLADQLRTPETVIHEFFLPKDGPAYCIGCFQCILKSEHLCPHHEPVQQIRTAIERSQIIIIDSPTYVLEMSGQLKALFDHFGYQWLSHRPSNTMFQKTGIAISTAAGAGAKRVSKSIKKQLFWMGISNCYDISVTVAASSWNEVSPKTKTAIMKKVTHVAKVVKKNSNMVSLRMKLLFLVMRAMQKNNNYNPVDHAHWNNQGWLASARPWKPNK